ncbi:MAG: Maf family protein [Acetobacteraceae bacterium]
MLQAPTPPLILASASEARCGLLAAAGLHFEVRPARLDESAVKSAAKAEGVPAQDAAIRLAALKAERVAAREPDALVIGADQILVAGEKWFDKPATVEAARGHLLALRGKPHILATAIVCQIGGQRIWQHTASPRLTMRAMSGAFLDDYLAAEGEAVTSSVGGYRLEGLGIHLFERIEGEHAAILGLPMLALLGFLRQHGVISS